MPREQDTSYIEPRFDDVLEMKPDDETFSIGQCYDKEAATTLCCRKCKSTEFNVGAGSYYTAVKCTSCDWQLCIHDG